MILKFAVCVETIPAGEELRAQLLRLGEQYSVALNVDIFTGGRRLNNSILNGMLYDAIYLDMDMKRTDVLALGRDIRNSDSTVLMLYLSGMPEKAADILELRAFRFLHLPLQGDKFRQYFCDVVEELQERDCYLRYRFGRSDYKVRIQDILYLESEKRKIYIHTAEDRYQLYVNLDTVEQILNNTNMQFLRIHKSFLANRKYIRRHSYDTIELVNGTVLRISYEKRKEIGRRLDLAGFGEYVV